jgi:hypothetical protein
MLEDFCHESKKIELLRSLVAENVFGAFCEPRFVGD